MRLTVARLRHIVCAMSGGVDSAVVAHLLLKQGHQVTGIHMSNWSSADDETTSCPREIDLEHAQLTCDRLGIELVHVDYAKEYWTNVFEHVIHAYRNGRTPNPDVLCNRHIKFDRLLKHVMGEMKADALATGHYAMLKKNAQGDRTLHAARDEIKDQTYFLAGVQRSALEHIEFPLGQLYKDDVKRIAREELNLEFLINKKESMGICFVGKRRDFGTFMRQYISSSPGPVADIVTGDVIHQHDGIHTRTIGQSLSTGLSQIDGRIVCRCDVESNTMFMAPHKFHPSLYSDNFTITDVNWLSPSVINEESFDCTVVCQRQFPISMMPCLVTRSSIDSGVYGIELRFHAKAIVPGQYAVFYRNGECLGGAVIESTGESLFEVETSEDNIIKETLHGSLKH